MAKLTEWALIATTLFMVFSEATAQDMRIRTVIRAKTDDVPEPTTQAPLVKSLMLFHSGKVYDYIEPAQEIVVFEPALRRFTILNKPRQLRSVLEQDEIRNYIGIAKTEVQKILSEPGNSKALSLLHFQLQPDFTVAVEPVKPNDVSKAKLSLTSPNFQYIVDGFAPPIPDIVENYLHVADWTAQFNSVLHPHTFLPGPRMALNQELRSQGLVPTSVELKVDAEPDIHLLAEHEWTWNLKDTDRQLIADWEKLLRDSNYRTVSFRQFQQEVLKASIARRR